MGWLKKRALPLTTRIDEYRPVAERMRVEDPDMYAEILAVAPGQGVAEELAGRDPNAYVAMHLIHAADHGNPWIPPSERGLVVQYRVDRWRLSAEHLRLNDPEFYELLRSQADAAEEETAKDDPDAYVAFALSKQADRHAQQLRAEDPKRYAKVLAESKGSSHEWAAQRDPDAYVGVRIAAAFDGDGQQP